MTYLHLDSLTRQFAPGTGVFDLTLQLERGRILALLGPSGSGKTTSLRLLGGFETPDRGRIVVEGQDVTALRPEARHFGMVFQHYALFPHLDVGQNVAFGLEARGVPLAETNRRVTDALALVDLAGFERRAVSGLSGGQQQRVALARALAPEPRMLLLDEPLSNLDPALRERTRRELRGLIRRVGITTVIVTHEQEDAFDLGDVIAVLRDGRLQQLGTPEALYREPANGFVAGFIGRSSWMAVTVVSNDAAGLLVRVGQVTWRVTGHGAGITPGQPLRLMIRPEALRFGASGEQGLPGSITDRRFAGAIAFYQVETSAGGQVEVSASPQRAAVGDRVELLPREDRPSGDSGLHGFAREDQ